MSGKGHSRARSNQANRSGANTDIWGWKLGVDTWRSPVGMVNLLSIMNVEKKIGGGEEDLPPHFISGPHRIYCRLGRPPPMPMAGGTRSGDSLPAPPFSNLRLRRSTTTPACPRMFAATRVVFVTGTPPTPTAKSIARRRLDFSAAAPWRSRRRHRCRFGGGQRAEGDGYGLVRVGREIGRERR